MAATRFVQTVDPAELVAMRPDFDVVARGVLDSLLEGCQVIGFDYRYVYLNETAARHGQHAPEELIGRTMMECYPGIESTPMYERLQRCMTERAHDRMDNEFTLPDGSIGCFELRFVPVPQGVCVLSLDVTSDKRARDRLRRMEEQLRHSQKMDAVGRLAGGVAHDFNNILSVILSFSDFLLDDLPAGDKKRDDVDEIIKAGKRAAALTHQLLMFSRQHVFDPHPLDLNEVLVGMDRMLQRILGADIDLVSLPGTGLHRVLGDQSSIEQVIMNLVVNARDAMPVGGKLTMETRNVVLDEAYCRDHLGTSPGPHVMLAVTDTGTGMDADTLAHIFEPFYTTKQVGKGTGLGLSTVFGIVQQSGGSIWVYSEVGVGTTFKIYLPAAAQDTRSAAAPARTADPRGSETVLLVEDDAQVRGAAREILVRSGYTVLVASDAGEATQKAAAHDGTIHLLLSDVVMPQLSGPELAKRLTATRPGMKVLCMSGYTDDSIVRHGVLDAGVAYIQKPITFEALAAKVRQVLDA